MHSIEGLDDVTSNDDPLAALEMDVPVDNDGNIDTTIVLYRSIATYPDDKLNTVVAEGVLNVCSY